MIGLKQSYCISLYSQAMVVGLQAFDFDNFSFGGTIFVEKNLLSKYCITLWKSFLFDNMIYNIFMLIDKIYIVERKGEPKW